jgi:hypothetical protein
MAIFFYTMWEGYMLSHTKVLSSEGLLIIVGPPYEFFNDLNPKYTTSILDTKQQE